MLIQVMFNFLQIFTGKFTNVNSSPDVLKLLEKGDTYIVTLDILQRFLDTFSSASFNSKGSFSSPNAARAA